MSERKEQIGEEYLTAEDVLRLQPFSHLKLATLKKWRHTGEGPRSVRIGRKPLYTLSEIIRWLSERERYSHSHGITKEIKPMVLPISEQREAVRRNHRLGGHKTERERRQSH